MLNGHFLQENLKGSRMGEQKSSAKNLTGFIFIDSFPTTGKVILKIAVREYASKQGYIALFSV